MAEVEFPVLPARTGESLRGWLSAGGPAEFHDVELRAFLRTVPKDALGFLQGPPRREANALFAWRQQAKGLLVDADWLYEKPGTSSPLPENWDTESRPWVQWARNNPVVRLHQALQDEAAARAAKAGKAPGARAALADALQRADGVQAAAEAEYDEVRVGLNAASEQLASKRVGKNTTPPAPVLTPVTLK